MGITAIRPSGSGGGRPRRVRSAGERETRSAVLWLFDFLDPALHYAAVQEIEYMGGSVSVSAVRFAPYKKPEPPPETVVGCALGISGGQGSSARGFSGVGAFWVPVWTKR